MNLPKIIKKNSVFLIPVLVFIIGIIYARSLEAFAGIGIVVMTLVLTLATLIGAISYRISQKILLSILIVVGSFIVLFGLLIILVRMGIF